MAVSDSSHQKRVFSQNLKRHMRRKDILQSDITAKFNLTASTVSDWCNGKKYPRVDKLQMLADYLGILKSDLTEEYKTNSKGVVIPVLGKVQAGIPVEAVENIIDYEEITKEMASQGEYFALQVQGASMEPRFIDGDVVIVKKQPTVENGETAIVLINGNNATIKKVRKSEMGIMLIPTNPDFEPLFFTNEKIETLPLIILGKVVELRAKF